MKVQSDGEEIISTFTGGMVPLKNYKGIDVY